METNRHDNIFPVTEEEILNHFNHVFNNPFQTRTIQNGSIWNIWTNETHEDYFSYGYTKGHSTSTILINKQGEKNYVEFFKFYKNSRISYGYSFKRRNMFKEILN